MYCNNTKNGVLKYYESKFFSLPNSLINIKKKKPKCWLKKSIYNNKMRVETNHK